MRTILSDHLSGEDLLSLREQFEFILPGDPQKKNSALVIFEHPRLSFYEKIYPLLKEYRIRALLGVCPRYIVEGTHLSKSERMKIPLTLAYQDGFFEEKAPFCTWEELSEMVRSGFVEIASASYSKMNLTFPFVDLEREIISSKKVLEENLPQAITTFLTPFGKKNRTVEDKVLEHYAYHYSLSKGFP